MSKLWRSYHVTSVEVVPIVENVAGVPVVEEAAAYSFGRL
jgi:hypothetical protein